jgi:hybrid cluster-associated redox disulfide protein
MKKEKITGSMTIGEIMQKHPEAGAILFQEGLMCVMCGMAQNETLEQGASAHGIDIKELLKKLNKRSK